MENETEQILDLTKNQETENQEFENIFGNNAMDFKMDFKMDFSALDLDLGF